MGTYFRREGHRRALCLADNEICVDKERWEGFREGFGPGADFWRIPMRKAERTAFYETRLDRLRGYSAVFAVSDFYAIELVQFLEERGVSVPEELSVAGFDDTPACRLVAPALTSVRQDVELRARLAMEKLRQLREGQNIETTVMLPVQLVVRGSTGPYQG